MKECDRDVYTLSEVLGWTGINPASLIQNRPDRNPRQDFITEYAELAQW